MLATAAYTLKGNSLLQSCYHAIMMFLADAGCVGVHAAGTARLTVATSPPRRLMAHHSLVSLILSTRLYTLPCALLLMREHAEQMPLSPCLRSRVTAGSSTPVTAGSSTFEEQEVTSCAYSPLWHAMAMVPKIRWKWNLHLIWTTFPANWLPPSDTAFVSATKRAYILQYQRCGCLRQPLISPGAGLQASSLPSPMPTSGVQTSTTSTSPMVATSTPKEVSRGLSCILDTECACILSSSVLMS